jgi:CRISPR/Cas system CSM-associated protein Csm2 small subunit
LLHSSQQENTGDGNTLLSAEYRKPDDSMVRKLYECSSALSRSQGRPKNRWEDDVKNDITRMKITNWKDSIRNRNERKKLVEKAKTSSKL